MVIDLAKVWSGIYRVTNILVTGKEEDLVMANKFILMVEYKKVFLMRQWILELK